MLAAFPICRVVPEFNIFSIFQFNLIITIPAKELIHSVFCEVLHLLVDLPLHRDSVTDESACATSHQTQEVLPGSQHLSPMAGTG